MLLQITGAYLVFRFQQIELKNEMRNYLSLHPDDPSITTIEYAINSPLQNDLKWEDDHEFKYQGQMYDVISRKIAHDKIVIKCIADKKETNLLKNFEQIMKRQSRGSKNRTLALQQLLNNLFEPVSSTVLSGPVVNNTFSYLNYTSPLSDNISEILTPPPKDC